MKITELTQKSHSEQLSEDRSKLDEGFWAPATALAGAGLSYYDLGKRFGSYNPRDWTAAQWKEAIATVAADAALGATGVGLAGVAGKALAKGGAKLAVQGAKRATKKADKAVQKANLRPGPTQAKVDAIDAKKQADAATKAATDKVAAAAAKRGITKGLSSPIKAYGTGTTANVVSQELIGKPVLGPSDIPVLGKKADGKPVPNPDRLGTATKIRNLDKIDLKKQGQFIMGK